MTVIVIGNSQNCQKFGNCLLSLALPSNLMQQGHSAVNQLECCRCPDKVFFPIFTIMHRVTMPGTRRLRHWQVFDWLSPVQGYLSDGDILSGSSEHDIELNLARLMTEIDRIIQAMHTADTRALNDETEVSLESPMPDTKQTLAYEKPVIMGSLTMEAGFLSNRGVTDLIKHYRKNAGNHGVVGLLKLFNTKNQNTWLAVTNSNLFCVLDNEDTRSSNRQVNDPCHFGKPAT